MYCIAAITRKYNRMTPDNKHFMAGLLMAAVLIAGIAVELVLVARWFKWPY